MDNLMSINDALAEMPPPGDVAEDAVGAANGEGAEAEVAPPGESEEAQTETGDEDTGEQPAEAAPPETEDWSDDRPWTPERVKAARSQALELMNKAHKVWGAAEKRANKVERKVEEFKRERDMIMAQRDTLAADMRTLRVGSADERMKALGRLAGEDPFKFFEDLSIAMATGAPKEARETAELREELAKLREELKGQKENAAQPAAELQVRRSVLDGVHNADHFPLVAQYAKGDPVRAALEIESIVVGRGRRANPEFALSTASVYDVSQALIEAESYLRKHPELLQPGAGQEKGAAASGADAGQETSAGANPGTARRTPGKSVTPALSTAPGGSRRVVTDHERMRELENDPAFLDSLGIKL